jgi:NAD(P)-dependent dehydrogenase (short-subunit alcohol dehydrogenase family)
MRFADTVGVVTGAGAGIGQTLARRLAGEGGRVACLDVDASAAAATAAAITADGGDAHAYACDVSDESQVEEALRSAERDFGAPIGVLFANAGVEGPIARIDDITVDEWDRTFAVNVRGPFLCAKHAAPSMRRNGGGAMVLTGSNSSFIAFPGWLVYTATKGALLMLAKNLAVDLAPDNIRVNAVCPGPTDTPMLRRRGDRPCRALQQPRRDRQRDAVRRLRRRVRDDRCGGRRRLREHHPGWADVAQPALLDRLASSR